MCIPQFYLTDYAVQTTFFWPRSRACRILVPQPRIEPVLPAVEEWSPNH